jgi:hypothetical protein
MPSSLQRKDQPVNGAKTVRIHLGAKIITNKDEHAFHITLPTLHEALVVSLSLGHINCPQVCGRGIHLHIIYWECLVTFERMKTTHTYGFDIPLPTFIVHDSQE